MNIEEVKSKVDFAKAKIEEINALRLEYQNALKNMDLNEASWNGFLQALIPYLEVLEKSQQEQAKVKPTRAKKPV